MKQKKIGYTDKKMVLAQKIDKKRQILSTLIQRSDSLARKDIAAWHAAWRSAISKTNPQRRLLYDIYTQNMIDNHLSGCISQRKDHTLQKPFILVDKKTGKESTVAWEYFQIQWVTQFMECVLDSIFWGYTVIELGEIEEHNGILQYTYAKTIPRKNVSPDFRRILRDDTDQPSDGLDIDDFSSCLIEVGNTDDLGLLLKVAPQCISKKNMAAYWDTFGEIFGMPLRVATTQSQNEDDWNQMTTMLRDMGSSGWALLPDGSKVEIVDSGKGDAFNVYDKRIDRCNSEISKAILGQTMTVDNGSSLSQSSTHLKIFEKICARDAVMLRNIINGKLLPIMKQSGFHVDGISFEWDNTIEFSPEQQQSIEQTLLQYYDIAPEYFVEKYKIPIIGVRNNLPDTLLSRPDDFFV